MGLFDFLKKKNEKQPTIAESEKQYYRPDGYYTKTVATLAVGADGNYIRKKVLTFDERKKISFPSSTGLYVPEILLLEYCSYGTYPHPKNGYPGFWWFSYGIRDVGAALKTLEDRGYIEFASAIDTIPKMTVKQLKEIASKYNIEVSGNKPNMIWAIVHGASEQDLEAAIPERKYKLTEKGIKELQENAYVPCMHKHPQKTVENGMFGHEFNVWTINRLVREFGVQNWEQIVEDEEAKLKY